jgi:hypothetical protein
MSTELHNDKFSASYIRQRIKELSPWYHKIDLGQGIVTPGQNYDRLWKSTLKVLDKLDYSGKRVLDIASWDGYWAFEAERRGARTIVSSDTRLEGFENLLFAKQVLGSKVIPLCNAPVQDLPNRLRFVGLEPEFDIVHHFGLLYHLRDPLLSLTQARAVMPVGSLLILETAFINDDINSYMAFSGTPGNYHFYGASDTWAPTKLCLREILLRSMLVPVMEESWNWFEIRSDEKNPKSHMESNIDSVVSRLGRITMIARAVEGQDLPKVDLRKLTGYQ